MICVTSAPEPATFQKRVREPGLRAIAEMVGERPPRRRGQRFQKIADRREDIPADKFPPYWTESLDDLMLLYHQICAIRMLFLEGHPVTGGRSVDHMAAKSRSHDMVYEWRNYRLACALLNARKKDFGDVLDPFEIVDGWFQLELHGFQVSPSAELENPIRTRVQDTNRQAWSRRFLVPERTQA